MNDNPIRYKVAMRRYADFGSWFRRERERRGFPSAAALSHRAGLAASYVSHLERGTARPKSPTVDRLADAMRLSPAERADLHRRAKLAGEPGDVVDALVAPMAGRALWQHLPELLLAVPHDEIWIWDNVADDLLSDCVRGFGSLLAWVALTLRPPTRAQREQLRLAAHRVFDRSLQLFDLVPTRGPRDIREAACDAASALPRAWRNELFGIRRVTARLAGRLRFWAYSPLGFRGSARLGVSLRDKRLDDLYSFTRATVESIVNVHDAMIAHRLWSDLDLTAALGGAGVSVQQGRLAGQLSPENGDLFDIMRLAPEHRQRLWSNDPGAGDRRDALYDAAIRVDLALRLFELPDLATAVLKCSRADITAALSIAAGLLGGVSERFPGSP